MARTASVYLVFMRDVATFEGGFVDAEAVQAALQRGATSNAEQLARGLVAYGAVLAMQSPDFVGGCGPMPPILRSAAKSWTV